MSIRQTIRRWLAVWVFFFLLSGIALAPLSLYSGSRVPAEVNDDYRVLDYYHFHWNLWWLKDAFLHGQDIWYTDQVLAPFTHNLTYHSLTAVLLPAYLVLEPLLGHLRAANLILWGSMALTGGLMAVYLRRMRLGWGVALAGGAGLMLSPYMLDHAASGHLNLLTVFWIPLALLAWEKTVESGRAAGAVLVGIVLWGMWFTDTLIILWGGLVLGPYALLNLAQARDWRARARLIVLGGLALAITIGLAWILGPLRQTLDFDTDQLAPARLLTLRYYALPLKALFLQPGVGDRSIGRLPVILVLAAAALPHRDRQRWFWLATGAIALVLALGPDVEVFGQRVPLPFRIIHTLFDGQMRTPARFLPPAMVGIVIFLARSFDPWLRGQKKPARRALAAGAAILLLIADFGAFHLIGTQPELPHYALYAMMGREDYPDYDYVVLEVPSGPFTGWRDLGTHPEAMYYGITHHKRMVSGLLSRIRLDQHLYYENSPLFGWLTGSRPLDPGPANSELLRIVDEWPVGYVVMHLNWLSSEKAQEALTLFNAHPSLCYLTTERDVVLYRTTSHPKGCPPRTPPETAPGLYTLNLGVPGDEGFIGHGWFGPENIGGVNGRWAGNSPAQDPPLTELLFYVDLPPGADYTLTLRATAFAVPHTFRPVAGNLIRGQLYTAELDTITIRPGEWADYTLTIPGDLITQLEGHLVISLAAGSVTSAAEQGLSDDTRGLSVAVDWVEFRRVEAAQ